ncbi:DUF5320 family protein [Maridesulfovibrio zosterae]|uniref:DUF5320 family protein n=1 Tax=Maridesulfovibrio zosterae TaxID=82171 RepID=UPI0004864566|nr:DUF5320 family protein [Maridesulfovibrio zosterae]
MPVINRNQTSSDEPGRGLGPCGAGQARGKSQNRGLSGNGMRQGRGMGGGRRNGMCRAGIGQTSPSLKPEKTLEERIAELEAENQSLRNELNK